MGKAGLLTMVALLLVQAEASVSFTRMQSFSSTEFDLHQESQVASKCECTSACSHEAPCAGFQYVEGRTPNNCVMLTLENGGVDSPVTASGYVKKAYTCATPVGIEDGTITDDAIEARTWYAMYANPPSTPGKGRLNGPAWCANYPPSSIPDFEWYQVELPWTMQISGIKVQGHGVSAQKITKFKIQYQPLGATDLVFLSDGASDMIFEALQPSDPWEHIGTVMFPNPIPTSRLRVVVKEYYSQNMCGRFELLRCD